MRPMRRLSLALILAASAGTLTAQIVQGLPDPAAQQPPPAQQQAPQQPPAQQAPQPQAQPQQAPAQAAPAAAAGAQPQSAPAAAPSTQPQAAPAPLAQSGAFSLSNASLTSLIDLFAQRLHINYILDPSVNGKVTVYTYGEIKPVDEMQMLQTILRINGFAMVQVGDMYRIVPVKMVQQLPIPASVNADSKSLPDDERMILNLVFLKYATSAEIIKIIQPFLGEGGQITTYDPANLLIIEDNSRNMKRTMDLVAMFDSDSFAGQRVKLFDVSNSRPSDLVKDLESVFKAYALSEKNTAVRFIAVDRINTVIAVAPNPGIFTEVKNWIDKLDLPAKAPVGSSDVYMYRLKYGRADIVAMAIMAVFTGNPWALMNLANAAQNGSGSIGLPGMGGGSGYGGGSYGGGYGGFGGNGGGAYPTGGQGYSNPYAMSGSASGYPTGSTQATATTGANLAVPGSGVTDLTGSYLGAASMMAGRPGLPSVIPNPLDNTIMVRAMPQDLEQIKVLLRQIDIPPRQVLIDARIYEVDLTGALSGGVQSYLDQKDSGSIGRTLAASAGSSGLGLSIGALVGRSHELLGVLSASETTSKTKLISSPSIIATDSIPATMNVGQNVPVLTSQAVGGVQVAGSSLFTNTVSYVNSGVTLSITARVNSSGVVTMVINQQVSSPQPPSTGSIQSDSFQQRAFNTQVTVQDGDTIAIGGFIQETYGESSAGIPLLHRIPILGAAFGAKSVNKARTELVVFLTPRVIYDTNQVADATDEIKSGLKQIQKLIHDQQ